MRTIYKYALHLHSYTDVVLPKDAEPLYVSQQGHTIQMWCLVNPDQPPETRRFMIVGTGFPILHDNILYIGTLLTENGIFVFHVFEVLEERKD